MSGKPKRAVRWHGVSSDFYLSEFSCLVLLSGFKRGTDPSLKAGSVPGEIASMAEEGVMAIGLEGVATWTLRLRRRGSLRPMLGFVSLAMLLGVR